MSQVFKYSLMISLAALTACTGSNSFKTEVSGNTDSIVGGSAVLASDPVQKSTVSLSYGTYLRPFCTGTLISKNIVVTAAHCVYTMAGKDFYVTFGADLQSNATGPFVVKAEKFFYNTDFKLVPKSANGIDYTSSENDIALVKLSAAAPDGFVPAPILEDSDKLVKDSKLLLAGFGVVDDDGKSATSMNQVSATFTGQDGEFLILDQSNGKGACYGDSGGPAYLETAKGLVVVGATHGAREGAFDCHHTTDYTSLSKHRTFLDDSIKLLEGEAPVYVMPDELQIPEAPVETVNP